AAIRPYSMAVAPDSSLMKRAIIFDIRDLLALCVYSTSVNVLPCRSDARTLQRSCCHLLKKQDYRTLYFRDYSTWLNGNEVFAPPIKHSNPPSCNSWQTEVVKP